MRQVLTPPGKHAANVFAYTFPPKPVASSTEQLKNDMKQSFIETVVRFVTNFKDTMLRYITFAPYRMQAMLSVSTGDCLLWSIAPESGGH